MHDESGRCMGTLSAGATQATLEASPGIQTWSSPRGKVATRMMDRSAVVKFGAQWSRNWPSTYPLDIKAVKKASITNIDGTEFAAS